MFEYENKNIFGQCLGFFFLWKLAITWLPSKIIVTFCALALDASKMEKIIDTLKPKPMKIYFFFEIN